MLRTARAAAAAATSVAVLDFANLSRDTSDAYLAEGLTEELTSSLGRVERLQVKSRSVVKRMQQQHTGDYRALGRVLGVRYLVEGSVRRSEARLRVSVRLVRAETGFRVWGDDYSGTTSDILGLEEEIARQVATAIAGRLLPGEHSSLAARVTRKPEAYDRFLRGNYFVARRDQRSFERAVTEYEAAARLDPSFTAALARSAYAYGLGLNHGRALFGLPAESLFARGAAAAARAIDQDPDNSDAWMARGFILGLRPTPHYEPVRLALARSVTLAPRNAEAWYRYGRFLREQGEDSAAAEAHHRALAAEPERAITVLNLGLLSYAQRRYEEALGWTDSAIAVDPAIPHIYDHRALIRARLGRFDAARADIATALSLGNGALSEGARALVEAHAGAAGAVRDAVSLARPELLAPDRPLPEEGLWAVAALSLIGAREEALAILGATTERSARLWVELRMPDFDSLRTEPRFQRLVEECRPPTGRP